MITHLTIVLFFLKGYKSNQYLLYMKALDIFIYIGEVSYITFTNNKDYNKLVEIGA